VSPSSPFVLFHLQAFAINHIAISIEWLTSLTTKRSCVGFLFILFGLTAPDAPDAPLALNVTTSTMFIQWGIPEPNGAPIKSYRLRMALAEDFNAFLASLK
jgi:hypothetical protein